VGVGAHGVELEEVFGSRLGDVDLCMIWGEDGSGGEGGREVGGGGGERGGNTCYPTPDDTAPSIPAFQDR